MRQPINGTITVTGKFKEKAQPGTGLVDASGVRRHVGTDLRASVGTAVFSPGSGVVTQSYSSSAGQTIELRIAGKLWRFMHLSSRLVVVGAKVSEGQKIALSGNSGGVAQHLHVDVRKDNTTWNQSLNNFYDYQSVINEANTPKPAPISGKRLYFDPVGQTATFYPVKGGTYAMKIKDASYNWSVLKTESNRVLVNSASAGGDCWVYLKYSNTNNTIPGRSVR